jgi:hypothetical protein
MSANDHKPMLKPSAGALRDAWMKSFSQNMVIGRLFGQQGSVIVEGLGVIEWLSYFKVIDSDRHLSEHTPQSVSAMLIKLAVLYNKANSLYSSLSMAAQFLADDLENQESVYIQAEIKRYQPGGDMYDEVARKTTSKTPAKETLEKMARMSSSDSRLALNKLRLEATFFQNIMANLETQRRCLKEYVDILRMDPTRLGMGGP